MRILSALLYFAIPTAAARFKSLQADASVFSRIPFDYIVVGGGTAGLVIAARLTEDPNVVVGVLEAGLFHADEPLITMPERFGQSIGNSGLDWIFLTTPQPFATGEPILWPRGKMLGGSSGMNFMALNRGSAIEYDAWEELGNPGWGWEGLLPYFKKSETYYPPPPSIFTADGYPSSEDIATYHGFEGPIQSTYNMIYPSITNPYVEAAENLGIALNIDSTDGNNTGVSNMPYSIDRELGVRSYSANGYFALSANRTNLHILTGAQASKIVFNNSTAFSGNLTATGVEYVFGRNTLTANASKEIILSAGSVQSPQLLELSGIGNATLLSNAGIPVLIDLPSVGENLQDQGVVPRDFVLTNNTDGGFDQLRNDFTYAVDQLTQYETSNTGFYAATMPAVMFLPLVNITSSETIASMAANLTAELDETFLTPLYQAQLNISQKWLNGSDVAFLEVLMFPGSGFATAVPEPGLDYMTIFTIFLHPFSRGSIHINSSNPLDPPIIDPQYFSRTIDALTMLQGGNWEDQLVQTQPLASYIEYASTPPAGTNFLNYTQTSLESIYHPIGTAALAPKELGGVVGPDLKVYGTSNIRVADASVMPMLVAAHLQSTVYAIAEKAADLIKADT